MNPARHFALIPAAGAGTRLGAALPKQYLRLAGKPMLRHALETFLAVPAIAHTFVVVSPEDTHIDAALAGLRADQDGGLSVLRVGGATRQQTVANALAALSTHLSAHLSKPVQAHDWILVHDAARPGLTADLVRSLIATLHDDALGGLLALPLVDTIKHASSEASGAQRVLASPPRERLWAAQTPQMFRYALLARALDQEGQFTDESSAVEALGLEPRLIPGSPRNFKVTRPEDLALAEWYLKGTHE